MSEAKRYLCSTFKFRNVPKKKALKLIFESILNCQSSKASVLYYLIIKCHATFEICVNLDLQGCGKENTKTGWKSRIMVDFRGEVGAEEKDKKGRHWKKKKKKAMRPSCLSEYNHVGQFPFSETWIIRIICTFFFTSKEGGRGLHCLIQFYTTSSGRTFHISPTLSHFSLQNEHIQVLSEQFNQLKSVIFFFLCSSPLFFPL